MNNQLVNTLLSELGHTRPVYWHISNSKAGYAYELQGDDPKIEYAKEKGYGVYFMVNTAGDVKNKKGNLRHEANITCANACFIDFDTGTKQEQLELIESLDLQPSAIVESGRGFHVYWFLHTDNLKLWRRIQTSLAEKYGGDTACNDPARLLRLPGSWHTKGEPMLVTLHSINDNRYTIEELEIFCPPAPERVFTLSPSSRSYSRYALTPCVLTSGNRHPELKRQAGRYLRGVAPVEISDRIAELKAWYALSCQPLKDEWEYEVETVADWIIQRELPGYGK